MFVISRNDLGNLVSVEDMFDLRPAPSTEFRDGSCYDSRTGWRRHICKVLPVCIIPHSETPPNTHVTALVCGLGSDEDRDWGLREWERPHKVR